MRGTANRPRFATAQSSARRSDGSDDASVALDSMSRGKGRGQFGRIAGPATLGTPPVVEPERSCNLQLRICEGKEDEELEEMETCRMLDTLDQTYTENNL